MIVLQEQERSMVDRTMRQKDNDLTVQVKWTYSFPEQKQNMNQKGWPMLGKKYERGLDMRHSSRILWSHSNFFIDCRIRNGWEESSRSGLTEITPLQPPYRIWTAENCRRELIYRREKNTCKRFFQCWRKSSHLPNHVWPWTLSQRHQWSCISSHQYEYRRCIPLVSKESRRTRERFEEKRHLEKIDVFTAIVASALVKHWAMRAECLATILSPWKSPIHAKAFSKEKLSASSWW